MTAPDHIRNSPEFNPDWDVLREPDGTPVTISWRQVQAIWHAVQVVEAVRRDARRRLEAEGTGEVRMSHGSLLSGHPEYQKSRLLGRMLIDGLPPTRTEPPREWSGPAWEAMPGGDPFRPPAVPQEASSDGAPAQS